MSTWVLGIAAYARPRDPLHGPAADLIGADVLAVVAWTMAILGATLLTVGLLARWWVFRTPTAFTTGIVAVVVTMLLWARLLRFV